jgi:small subunit ribosomal protein S6
MREYELIYLVHPDLDENSLNEIVNRISGWITESGGEIIKTEIWGKRKLAYPIHKQKDGQYVFVQMKIAPTSSAALEHNIRFLEPILRFSIVLK